MKMRVAPQILQGVPPTDQANDIAAFANTSGGVLLVGASESPVGVLSAYVAVDYATAQQVVDAYRRALLECSPHPVIDARPIELPSAGNVAARYVVAVNCDPYLAPVGVRMPGQTGGEKSWFFPVRRGTNTRHLGPEELGTIMEPRLRRLSLQLSALLPRPAGSGARPYFYFTDRGLHAGEVARIDAEGSSVAVKLQNAPSDMIIPLEAVRMMWTDPFGATHIAIDGVVTDSFHFRPSRL